MLVKNTIKLGQQIVEQAKEELNKEKELKYKEQTKTLLEDIQEAKRTVDLLEKQLRNFMREVDLNN